MLGAIYWLCGSKFYKPSNRNTEIISPACKAASKNHLSDTQQQAPQIKATITDIFHSFSETLKCKLSADSIHIHTNLHVLAVQSLVDRTTPAKGLVYRC